MFLKRDKLVAIQKKCYFGQTTVDYLGHIISKDASTMDPNIVKSVIEWPVPRNVNGVHGFLVLTGYYL